jgi:transposase
MLSADQVPVKNPHSRMQWPVWVVLIAGSTGSAPHGQSLLGLKSRAEYIAPTAGVIDSQSVKTTEAGGPRGFDAGKKIKGRKRHLLTDTAGFLIAGIVHEASTQDRDGAPALFKLVRSAFPWLRHVFADGGDAGQKLQKALDSIGRWTVEIVKRSDVVKGFKLLPRRWVVERTIAWINRNRRLAKDFEATIESAETWLMIASVKLLSRRLARA